MVLLRGVVKGLCRLQKKNKLVENNKENVVQVAQGLEGP